ncbi:MAG: zinc finger Ran-binding domain-containing protein [Candidatus Thorarchaeota archaeon]
MRVCPKCNKSNLPTRKYCIRCGASLIVPPKKRAVVDDSPKPEVPELGRVTTGEDMARQATESAAPPPTTNDKWVKPSEVSRDRVRTASGAHRKTELEKAREAFARAEDVGIDEDGTGVIETRMLRASEVRELLEATQAAADAPTPMMMEGSESLTPEEIELMQPTMPKAESLEEQILGSHSAFVASEEQKSSTPEKTLDTDVSRGFSSSRYEEEDGELDFRLPEQMPTVTAETLAPAPTPATAPPTSAPTPTLTPAPTQAESTPSVSSSEDELDYVTICHKCGAPTNIDQFEYPAEVYSAMGAARLKQARFYVVQGKPDQAMQSLRLARSLYKKAGDETGLHETKRLIDSLARES